MLFLCFIRVKKTNKVDMKERVSRAFFMNVTVNVIREIIGELLVFAVWKKLEELYFTKLLRNRLYFKKMLYNMIMSEGMPIKQHLDKFNLIVMDLNNIDRKNHNKDHILIALCYCHSLVRLLLILVK